MSEYQRFNLYDYLESNLFTKIVRFRRSQFQVALSAIAIHSLEVIQLKFQVNIIQLRVMSNG